MSTNKIKEQLLTLLDDYRDFNSSPITVQPIPTSVEFAKQVSKGYPCLYQAYTKTRDENGRVSVSVDPSLLEYPCFKWTKQDLLNLVDEEVEVAVTPTGRADDLHRVDGEDEAVFLAPAAINMTIEDLLDKLTPSKPHQTQSTPPTNPSKQPIYYLQSQNSNLTTTPLHRLHKHIPPTLPFADQVLSPTPEATNIWIGTHHSTTSLHRDPYENLYLVLKGSKTFRLYPPVDELVLPTVLVRTGRYVFDDAGGGGSDGGFAVEMDQAEAGSDGEPPSIPWISIDPTRPRDELIAEHEMYAFSSPRVVEVSEGQVLYLPSGWFHHVTQSCGVWDRDADEDGGVSGQAQEEGEEVAPCIAVNYWYDMEYEGEKYVMRQLIGRLKEVMIENGGQGGGEGGDGD